MGDGTIPVGRGVVPRQVAEIIVTLDGEPGRRGSGYRVGPTSVLTAAHVIEGAVSVRVRFDADLPGEWTTEAISGWADPRSDLAVLSIAPPEGEPAVAVARFGRIGGDRAAVLTAQAVGFPLFKVKNNDGTVVIDDDRPRYHDSYQADGSVAVLSNRREGTLEVTVPPPEPRSGSRVSPWEGMSGAAVWVGDRIVGVIAKHHRSDGLGRLAAARLDLALAGLDQRRRAELRTLLALPDVVPDVVPPSTGELVITAYQAQVRDIAPDRLLDRGAELGELVGFCAGEQPYAWWQAGPWAGKSALMAWFVLHSPAGVDVVSFFVTARLAGQSDSEACTNALIEQLAALIGESPASLLTAGARRGTLLRLLEDAAKRAREAGRRLLLVIDGLDEDSGTTTSIAALLPRRPPPEVRVLVASRPHPPIPDDVPGDHALRTISPRQLDVSEHARDVERRAKHELKQLLAGDNLQREVLGFITAAGGGLTLGDLEQLTQRPPFEIDGLLGGLFGRSVGSRIGRSSVGYPDERVYLFTHETLKLVAEQQYGNSLTTYRNRLHNWADSCQRRGWATDTPHYLLRGYTRMLASTGNLARLVASATDQIRHDRMRHLTGGDALAFTEISTAQTLILDQPDPDLTSLAILTVQREHLTDRNSNIPIELPAVWAMIGQPTRAEALADSIPNHDRRAQALTRLVKVTTIEDPGRAARLAEKVIGGQFANRRMESGPLVKAVAIGGSHDRAETLAMRITGVLERVEALTRLAEVVAISGDHDRAERITDSVPDQRRQAEALVQLAEMVAAGGDANRAARLADRAETLANSTDQGWKAKTLARLVRATAAFGDRDRATRLADKAEALTNSIFIDWRARLDVPAVTRVEVVEVVEALATSSDHDRAERIADAIPDLGVRVQALIQLVDVATGSDPERAARLAGKTEVLAEQLLSPHAGLSALARLTEVVGAGDSERAARLADKAENLAVRSTGPYERVRALARLVEVVAISGDHDRAERLADSIPEHHRQAEALARLAEVVAAGGDADRAARLAHKAEDVAVRTTDRQERAEALARLVEVVAAICDPDRAALPADAAIGGLLAGWHMESGALARLVEVVAASGSHDRAEALAMRITDAQEHAEALARLVEVVSLAGDLDRAVKLADKAEILAGKLASQGAGSGTLARLVKIATISGDHDRAARLVGEAEALAGQINNPDEVPAALCRLVEVVAASGDHDRAAFLVGRAEDAVVSNVLGDLWTDTEGALDGLHACLVEALGAGGDYSRAEEVAARVADDHERVDALVRLVGTVAHSDHDRMARLIRQAEVSLARIPRPSWVKVSRQLAMTLASKIEASASIEESKNSRSPLLIRARKLLAEILVVGSLTDVLPELARVDPIAVRALADELQKRWKLAVQASHQDQKGADRVPVV